MLALPLFGCDGSNDVYTLYRGSIVPDVDRIHVATFDAKEGAKYNQENCMSAAHLFAAQPGVTVRYWCERGHHKG